MNYLDLSERKRVIDEIEGNENVQRKLKSFKQTNMQNDNFYQYMRELLEYRYDCATVDSMAIFSTINLQRRVSKQEASLYKKAPSRQYSNLNPEQESIIDLIYKDASANSKLRRVNEAFKYQNQGCIQVLPQKGKITLRPLLLHHYDVIPDMENPEIPEAYILSTFDYTTYDRLRQEPDISGNSQGDIYRDLNNQKIADWDDPGKPKKRYVFWTKKYNFICNHKGQVLDKITKEVITNPVEDDLYSDLFKNGYEILPFVDFATYKDFEFWVRSGDALFDSTLLYNMILTSENLAVELQGKAQAYYKGAADHLPENLRVGVDKIIHIPIDPNNPVQSEFGFVNPNADLASIREYRESFLAAFLSSRGIDTSTISGSPSANVSSTGIERLLKMIEKFEASQEDMDAFQHGESLIYKIIISWIKAVGDATDINGNRIINPKYVINFPEPDDTELMIEYEKPQAETNERDRYEFLKMRRDDGTLSRVDMLMEIENIDRDTAIERIQEIDEIEGGFNAQGREQADVVTREDESDL